MRGKKSRLAVGVVAAAGACALLAACSPVKMGAAAIVGNDRITASSLNSQVSNLQSDLQGAGANASDSEVTTSVLEWLIRFQIQDQVAANAGITVSQTDGNQALNLLLTDENQYLQSQGGGNLPSQDVALFEGVPNSLKNQLGTYLAQFIAFEKQANGGALPTTAAGFEPDAAYSKASCQAREQLNIQVNPQYGQLDYDSTTLGSYVIVPSNDVLSRPTGKASPATTPSFPSC